MGVFDDIRFEAGIEGCPIQDFQTKDLEGQCFEKYSVSPNGLLLDERGNLERHDGTIRLYETCYDGLLPVPEAEEWFEYLAELRDGVLVGPPVRVEKVISP